eukprot:m.16352 g.16352  ORF g.16352 m.16352 type:complete len:113 (-) comp3376_c0_seq2:279-617(-)
MASRALMHRMTTICMRSTSMAPRLAVRNMASIEVKKTESEAAMEAKLKDVLEATTVNVEDVSGGCGSAFLVEVESPQFKGLSKIKQHRLVTTALADEVAEMHSIRVFTAVPE